MEQKQVTECAVCAKEIEILDEFNIEMLCPECYENETVGEVEDD